MALFVSWTAVNQAIKSFRRHNPAIRRNFCHFKNVFASVSKEDIQVTAPWPYMCVKEEGWTPKCWLVHPWLNTHLVSSTCSAKLLTHNCFHNSWDISLAMPTVILLWTAKFLNSPPNKLTEQVHCVGNSRMEPPSPSSWRISMSSFGKISNE